MECPNCGLPMSFCAEGSAELIDTDQYICDGPNDNTQAVGCWGVITPKDVEWVPNA